MSHFKRNDDDTQRRKINFPLAWLICFVCRRRRRLAVEGADFLLKVVAASVVGDVVKTMTQSGEL